MKKAQATANQTLGLSRLGDLRGNELTQLVHTRKELAEVLADHPRVLIPTMGALHLGHKALVAAAKNFVGGNTDAKVVMSIFVNPLQFDNPEDLGTYPDDLVTDSALATEWGVDVIWAPTTTDIYGGSSPGVPVGLPELLAQSELADVLEGAARPGHFQGVLTAVWHLFDAVKPQAAFFGEKDFQQLSLVRLLASDLSPGVEIVAVPTVRDEDGMALASRLSRLTQSQISHAHVVPRALAAGVAAAEQGSDARGVRAAVLGELDSEPNVHPEYVEVVDEWCLPAKFAGPARILLAVVVAGVRVIDNEPIELQAV